LSGIQFPTYLFSPKEEVGVSSWANLDENYIPMLAQMLKLVSQNQNYFNEFFGPLTEKYGVLF
jgi:hypothetical protein